MEAAISADIVKSTTLDSTDLFQLREELKRTIDYFDQKYKNRSSSKLDFGFWGRIVKGDSIECYLSEVNWALRVALALKLKARLTVNNMECSADTKKYGLRFAIGAGKFKTVDKEKDIIDGEPIYLSGREMQKNKKPSDKRLFLMEDDRNDICPVMNSFVAMLDNMINKFSIKQCEAVVNMLLDYDRSLILDDLTIAKSSLSDRLKSADWQLLNNAIISFENYNFDRSWFTLS